jgi:ribosomal protein S18 acetylase RimI-like enzyme
MTELAAMLLTYRYADAQDVPAVRRLIEQAYRGAEARKGWSSESDLLLGPRTSEAEIARLVALPDTRFVLMEEGDRLAGCALIEKRGENGYFGMFAIDPNRQQGGLGKALLDRLEAAVQELWGVGAMTLTVISLRSELIAFYERRGYRLTGQHIPFPFSETSGETRRDFDLIEMQKLL